mmetsp:Transcript_26122/g.77869  ORF Transcript_26122/g.77869 Transcript_26122/m.77869 type:complete len:216 (+) Transcript_26122:225-872(+)
MSCLKAADGAPQPREEEAPDCGACAPRERSGASVGRGCPAVREGLKTGGDRLESGLQALTNPWSGTAGHACPACSCGRTWTWAGRPAPPARHGTHPSTCRAGRRQARTPCCSPKSCWAWGCARRTSSLAAPTATRPRPRDSACRARPGSTRRQSSAAAPRRCCSCSAGGGRSSPRWTWRSWSTSRTTSRRRRRRRQVPDGASPGCRGSAGTACPW